MRRQSASAGGIRRLASQDESRKAAVSRTVTGELFQSNTSNLSARSYYELKSSPADVELAGLNRSVMMPVISRATCGDTMTRSARKYHQENIPKGLIDYFESSQIPSSKLSTMSITNLVSDTKLKQAAKFSDKLFHNKRSSSMTASDRQREICERYGSCSSAPALQTQSDRGISVVRQTSVSVPWRDQEVVVNGFNRGGLTSSSSTSSSSSSSLGAVPREDLLEMAEIRSRRPTSSVTRKKPSLLMCSAGEFSVSVPRTTKSDTITTTSRQSNQQQQQQQQSDKLASCGSVHQQTPNMHLNGNIDAFECDGCKEFKQNEIKLCDEVKSLKKAAVSLEQIVQKKRNLVQKLQDQLKKAVKENKVLRQQRSSDEGKGTCSVGISVPDPEDPVVELNDTSEEAIRTELEAVTGKCEKLTGDLTKLKAEHEKSQKFLNNLLYTLGTKGYESVTNSMGQVINLQFLVKENRGVFKALEIKGREPKVKTIVRKVYGNDHYLKALIGNQERTIQSLREYSQNAGNQYFLEKLSMSLGTHHGRNNFLDDFGRGEQRIATLEGEILQLVSTIQAASSRHPQIMHALREQYQLDLASANHCGTFRVITQLVNSCNFNSSSSTDYNLNP